MPTPTFSAAGLLVLVAQFPAPLGGWGFTSVF